MNTPNLPVSSRPDFIPLPSDPKMVTAEQRRVAFPGIEKAVIGIGRAYVAAHLATALPAAAPPASDAATEAA